MAKALGISQSGLNRYEYNESPVMDETILKYADYLLARTDKPEGILFKHEPELLKRKVVREEEWGEFVEACFDPRSPMNKKLKELILTMSGGEDNKKQIQEQ